MADAHTNFAYSTVVGTTSKNGSNPGAAGTSITVQDGDSAKFPSPPFNATVWPAGAQPTSTNAEIVTVTSISDDTLTITRNVEAPSFNRTIIVGDQIAATITAKTLTDAETPTTYYSPPMLASSQSALQSLASASGMTGGTGSFFMFPFTVPNNLRFNEILLANSLSFVSLAVNSTANNAYTSMYAIYSRNVNTLNMISSSSFSIGETLSSTKLTWNYPTATATVNATSAGGWAYGALPSGNLTAVAQISSYISGLRVVGLQFGNSMSLSGGVYWMGLLSVRSGSTNVSSAGLSNVGIVGSIIGSVQQAGTTTSGNSIGLGILPVGVAASAWSNNVTNFTQWWGRHIVGFITTAGVGSVPGSVAVSSLGNYQAAVTASVIPALTFVST